MQLSIQTFDKNQGHVMPQDNIKFCEQLDFDKKSATLGLIIHLGVYVFSWFSFY